MIGIEWRSGKGKSGAFLVFHFIATTPVVGRHNDASRNKGRQTAHIDDDWLAYEESNIRLDISIIIRIGRWWTATCYSSQPLSNCFSRSVGARRKGKKKRTATKNKSLKNILKEENRQVVNADVWNGKSGAASKSENQTTVLRQTCFHFLSNSIVGVLVSVRFSFFCHLLTRP